MTEQTTEARLASKLTADEKSVLKAQARGSWQREVIGDLVRANDGGAFYPDQFSTNPMYYLRGNARNYMGRYQQSFSSLIERVRDAGFVVDVKLGPKGGYWSAQYRIRSI